MHLETGIGKYTSSSSSARGTAEYKYHFTDYTNVKRLHNYDALFVNDTAILNSPSAYDWKTFDGGVIPPEPSTGLLYRKGIYGYYWGNDYSTSNHLSYEQMKVNAQYLYSALTNAGWSIYAISALLREYAVRKLDKSAEDGNLTE